MNVLFISNDPTIFTAGSAVRARMRAYAEALGEVHVLSAAPRGTREEAEGPLYLHPVGAGKLLRLLLLYLRARRLIRQKSIKVVSAQDPFEYGLVALLATLGTHASLHLQLHTDPFASGFARLSLANRLRCALMSFTTARAAHIRVVALPLKEALEARYHPRAAMSVLPIYTDLARFRAIVRNPEKGHLLWVGRFEKEKDPMLALETLAALRAAGIDAHLSMLGTGRLHRAVTARAKVRGLSSYVELPGRVDLVPFLARAELVLATSHYEGYGLTILESLAAGVPVLSTDVGIARVTGASIAPRESFIQKAAELMQGGPPTPPNVGDTYPSFEAYVRAYAADIKAALL